MEIGIWLLKTLMIAFLIVLIGGLLLNWIENYTNRRGK